MTLHIGYAQSVITPSLDRPVYLAGFGQNRRALTIHDDLYARALALTDGSTSVVLVAVDLIGLGHNVYLALQNRLCTTHPGAGLLIAATHTHHGPDTIGLWGPDESTSGVDPAYMAGLQTQIADTADRALSATIPAQFRAASIDVPGVVRNGRDPEILDQELTCHQFFSPVDNSVLATWLIFPCHPEVLWDNNLHITADYIDAMRCTVEAASGAPCLVMVGALGGMMTPAMPGHTFDDAERMGIVLAEAALSALHKAAPKPLTRFAYRRHELVLPMQNPLFEAAQQAGLLPDLKTDEGMVKTEASLVQLGDSWFIGVPGELLPELGLQFKAMLKKSGAQQAAVIGLANDELGYILPDEGFVTPKDWFEPGDSYEESMSVCPHAGSSLTAAIRTLLSQSTS